MSRTLVRHEGEAPKERSTCGWRHLLISRQDTDVAAWAHAVESPARQGSIVHIPPGFVHSAKGRMRVLVVGIPDET